MPAIRQRLGLPQTKTAASYAVGDRIDVPANLYDSSSATLLVFARSTCSACEAAKPTFATLTAELGRKSSTHVLMIIGTAQAPEELAYAKALGLDETQL